MLVTREMDYAIRIVRALHEAQPLTSSQIAEREHVQPATTRKMLRLLKEHGLVKGNRGHIGGYTLLQPCSALTLYDLLHALEGPLFVTQCLNPDHDCQNNSCGQCQVHREFARIQSTLDQELKAKKLEELF